MEVVAASGRGPSWLHGFGLGFRFGLGFGFGFGLKRLQARPWATDWATGWAKADRLGDGLCDELGDGLRDRLRDGLRDGLCDERPVAVCRSGSGCAWWVCVHRGLCGCGCGCGMWSCLWFGVGFSGGKIECQTPREPLYTSNSSSRTLALRPNV